MFGATLKSWWAKKNNIDPKNIVSVSIMPCTAKKFEVAREEMCVDGFADVDYAGPVEIAFLSIHEDVVKLFPHCDERSVVVVQDINLILLTMYLFLLFGVLMLQFVHTIHHFQVKLLLLNFLNQLFSFCFN